MGSPNIPAPMEAPEINRATVITGGLAKFAIILSSKVLALDSVEEATHTR